MDGHVEVKGPSKRVLSCKTPYCLFPWPPSFDLQFYSKSTPFPTWKFAGWWEKTRGCFHVISDWIWNDCLFSIKILNLNSNLAKVEHVLFSNRLNNICFVLYRLFQDTDGCVCFRTKNDNHKRYCLRSYTPIVSIQW